MRFAPSPAFFLAAALSMAGTLVGDSPRAAPTIAFRVVVNASNPVNGVARKFLEEVYLKKITRWSSGAVIRPIDLGPETSTRRQFSREILRRSVAAVKSYWQQMIFSGRDVPPPEVDTDEQVVRYIVKHEEAVGYVSGDADLDGVKVLTLR